MLNSKPPSNTAFKQQRLKACQPIFTPTPVILILLVIGAAFVAIGAVLLTTSDSLLEYSVRYDNQCAFNSTCSVLLDIQEKMVAPVYFYYELNHYYQNHRRYVSSRSDYQLRGGKVTSYGQVSSCDPDVTSNDKENLDNLYLPCGLIALSNFNDTFELSMSNGTSVAWTKDGIAWQSDLDEKFKNPPAGSKGGVVVVPAGGAEPDYVEPTFVNWMRTAALPKFRKLYRIIKDQDLPKGQYNITIQNEYPVRSFSGEKSIVISEVSWMGGKNEFLGVTYLVVAGLCLVFAIGFAIAVRLRPRSLGDISSVKRFEMHPR